MVWSLGNAERRFARNSARHCLLEVLWTSRRA